MKASEFLNKEEKKSILDAIKNAENQTSGEIRVHIETMCKGDVLDCAVDAFAELGMHKTKLRNGVLIYLSVMDRQLAIIGDAGINSKVTNDFWDSTRDLMIMHFKKNEFAIGLAKGIEEAGVQLKKYFPFKSDDVNELSDDISYGA